MKAPKASRTDKNLLNVPGIELHQHPPVYLAAIPGRWLLDHSTPSWRIVNPRQGFQRIVNEQRAKEIARTVIETRQTFPNAITLATNLASFEIQDGMLVLPHDSMFLVVDGQHRLFAQKFAAAEALYSCVVHMDRTEQQMARLFLEINDNQRRVPSSLRWDLVRLVRSEDQATQMTGDLVYELATNKESPFYSVGIDLTGEQKDGSIKQGSLAPEIRALVSRLLKKNKDLPFSEALEVLMKYFTAVRSLDPDGWGTQQSPFYRARVLRALIRVLSDILASEGSKGVTAEGFRRKLRKIDPATISDVELRKAQGSAGVQDLYKAMSSQIVGK